MGGYVDEKLFATSFEDAYQFGRINFALDKNPFHIIRAKAPTILNVQLISQKLFDFFVDDTFFLAFLLVGRRDSKTRVFRFLKYRNVYPQKSLPRMY